MVTGGSGFVGGHLIRALAQNDTLEIVRAGREPDCEVHFDLERPETIANAVEAIGPDIVFHLAGEASVAAASRDAALMWRTGLAGSLALAEALAEYAPACTLVFASSAEVYGAAFLDGVANELTRPAPQSPYAQTKLATEQMLAAVLPKSTTLIVARPSNHVGPGQHERFALPSFAAQLAFGEERRSPPLIRVGNLDAERDFMDVRDVVQAYLMLIERYAGSGGRYLFNIASGTARTVGSLLEALRGQATIASEIEIDPDRLRREEIPRAALDAARLRSATGWLPLVSIGQSIQDILQDARQRLAPRKAHS